MYSDAQVGRKTYLRIILKDAVIVSYHVSGSGSDDQVPPEELSVSFTSIEFQYTASDDAGAEKGNLMVEIQVEAP
jgi:type VI protein secretion system component Hcp